MARKKIDFDTVRDLVRELPGVDDSTAYGSPAIKVNGTLMACIAINKSAEPGSLMVRIDMDQRSALLAEAPDVYYLADHYAPYPCVLVRMSRVSAEVLRDLLRASWKFVTSQQTARKRAPRKRKPARA